MRTPLLASSERNPARLIPLRWAIRRSHSFSRTASAAGANERLVNALARSVSAVVRCDPPKSKSSMWTNFRIALTSTPATALPRAARAFSMRIRKLSSAFVWFCDKVADDPSLKMSRARARWFLMVPEVVGPNAIAMTSNPPVSGRSQPRTPDPVEAASQRRANSSHVFPSSLVREDEPVRLFLPWMNAQPPVSNEIKMSSTGASVSKRKPVGFAAPKPKRASIGVPAKPCAAK